MVRGAREPRPCPYATRGGGPATTWCGGIVAPPPSPLWTPCTCRENRRLGFRFVQFWEYFLCNFSETKNRKKQETGTRHLINRLVPENVNKCNKMDVKHVANGIIWAWNIRNYRYVGDVSSILKLRSEEHTSELQSHHSISYAVFCLKKIFFNDTATTEIYTNLNTLCLHDALPISCSKWYNMSMEHQKL